MLGTQRQGLVHTVGWADPEAQYVLAASISGDARQVVARGFWGEIRFDGSVEEIAATRELLRRLDGQTRLGELDEPLPSVVAALGAQGAIFDARHAWAWFNELSANPAPFYGLRDPMEAYDLAVWEHPGAPRRRPVVPHSETSGRSSALHDPRHVDSAASYAAAVAAARAAYGVDPERGRPLPSAGAIYPTHLWVLGKERPGIDHELSYVAEQGDEVRDGKRRSEDVLSVFAGDALIDETLIAGAAVVAVLVDPGQMIAKYGNRGWRYCLIEAGAVMLRAQDHALAAGARLRPFGGFRDEALASLIGVPLVPTLTLLVTSAGL